jgi:hypothetical protein
MVLAYNDMEPISVFKGIFESDDAKSNTDRFESET